MDEKIPEKEPINKITEDTENETALSEEDKEWLDSIANPIPEKKEPEQTPPPPVTAAAIKTHPVKTRTTSIPKKKKTATRKKPKKTTRVPLIKKHSKPSPPRISKTKISIMIAISAIMLLVIASLIITYTRTANIRPENQESKVITLITSACEACTIPQEIAQRVLSANITSFQETDLETEEGKKLAQEYEIKTLPAIIILNSPFPDFEARGNAAVYEAKDVPYYDIASQNIIGAVSAIILKDSSCADCADITTIISQLQEAGIAIMTTETVETDSEQGKEIIAEYGIQKVPTLILDKEAEKYRLIATNWDVIGTRETDGSYIIRNVTPPYQDLATGQVKGLIRITYLIDSSCTICYDVLLHRQVLLDKLAMKARTETTFDIASSDGQDLIKKYAITKVPTVIISEDAQEYPFFIQIWALLGTIEKDGTAVFRNFDALSGQSYRNLESDEIITSPSPGEPSS
ncbi:MAG: hypothetical protein ABIJ21_06225 [Nanoarchaeota archaeon]